MISWLKGEVIYQGKGFAIVRSNEIGYKIFFPEDEVQTLRGGIEIFTHEVFKDTEHELFGFKSIEALELFWKLISVSGVGPKSAQKIVFAQEISVVKSHIAKDDIGFLTSVQGIGKKTAQKIILELKGILKDDESTSSFDEDAIVALVSLGYQRKEAESVLSLIDLETTEERVKAALKMLGR